MTPSRVFADHRLGRGRRDFVTTARAASRRLITRCAFARKESSIERIVGRDLAYSDAALPHTHRTRVGYGLHGEGRTCMTREALTQLVADMNAALQRLITEPATYLQLGIVAASFVLAFLVVRQLRRLFPALAGPRGEIGRAHV